MADLPNLLLASLNPATRKQAEQSLHSLSTQSGFLSHLLRLVLEPSQDRAVRLSGSVYLKNIAKTRWEEDEPPIAEQDKAALRAELIPAMLALSQPADKSIRVQVAESVSLIAELDFPSKWPTLIDQLVSSLSPTDYNINTAVLETAHSIFRPWRAQARSDSLFTDINYVLQRFMTPYLQLLRQTAGTLLAPESATNPSTPLMAQSMVQLVDIYYDFTCQDLPPDIEDSHEEFFSSSGWWIRFLSWDPAPLRGDPDDTTPSVVAQIKTGILEILELFVKLYPEQLQKSASIPSFVQGVWSLLGSSSVAGVGNDGLVSQSLKFLSTAIKCGYYKDLFSSKDTIASLTEGVIVPNVALREHELEQFEDDPLEYIRRDLALTSSAGGDVGTRRQGAADVVRALATSGLEVETTEVVGKWINDGLKMYSDNPSEGWRAKDSAIFLFAAIATKGTTTAHGVTSTNALVNVVDFFSQHVFQDLQAAPGSVHPILQVDAIRFLYVFRNQLTKEQLISVLPLLVRHLGSDTYVTYTYAATTIERILFIKQNNQLLFAQADIHDFAPSLVDALLTKIEAPGTAEKIAENEHLMKCAMRVIFTARQTLTPVHDRVLTRLVGILGIISKNPSNPNFDQYIFESISGLMRFIVAGSPATLPAFEQQLFGPFTYIIQQDIDQYIPYVYQVLAQMLSLHTTDVPAAYRTLVPFLLTPAVWQQKGSIPGLVKLLKAFLEKDSQEMIAQDQVKTVLAVVQQRLIPSKLNDAWGFDLVQAVVQFVPASHLKQYFKPVIMSLLTRLQTSKTDKYVYHFSYFLLFAMAVNPETLSPDFVISTVEEVQPGLWVQVLNTFVLPQLGKMPVKDRKVAVVGMSRMLTQSEYMLQEPAQAWPVAFTALVKLFQEGQYLTKSEGSDDPHAGITDIDYEEQTAGYQAAYSRLAASEENVRDPVGYVSEPRQFLSQQLVALSGKAPGMKEKLARMVQSADPNVVRPFVEAAVSSGFAFV